MESNVAGVVDILCTKFGTTIENLLPAIIEFGKYDCQLTARVCVGFIIFGIALVVLGYLLVKYTEFDILPGLCIILGICAILIAAFILVVALATLSEWNHCPEVMAYKYILRCLR